MTFLDNGNVLGTATISGGTATLTTSTLKVGPQTIVASYAGDGTFTGSTSAAASVDVTLTAALAVQAADTAGDVASQPLTVIVK